MQSYSRLAVISFLSAVVISAVLSLSAVYGEETKQPGEDAIWIGGRVVWPGHDLTKASVEVFKDPKFKELYTRGLLLKPEGMYALTIDDPGTYYIVAFVDDNDNNRFDAGDGMGIYGIADWADPDQEPKPIQLERGMKLPGIDIQVTALVDDQGRMMSISSPGSGVAAGISGKLIWLNPPSPPLKRGDEEGSLKRGDEDGALKKEGENGALGKRGEDGSLRKGSEDGALEGKGEDGSLGKGGEEELDLKEGGEGKFTNAIVFVYSDPSWNNRIAQTDVEETGEYEVSVPAGRYYLLAIIDENNTNLLDVGDRFGIWGMTKFGMFPKAVEVEEGRVTKDRNILIIGQMGISGKLLPLQEAAGTTEKVAPLEDKISLSGNVVWPGHDLKFGMVQAYSDPSMTVTAAQAKSDGEGRFRLLIPAGDYYIVAGVDADGDGKYTAGDGIGAYGVANAADQMPEKLTISENSQNEEINLVITAEFDDSGQLKPLESSKSLKSLESLNDLNGFNDLNDSTQYTGISGRIIWEGCTVTKATLVFSNEPRFESGTRTPLQLDDDGSYKCVTPPGDYYIMAIADHNDNDQVDAGDGIGFYGAGYWGAPQKVTVLEGKVTSYINIDVTASFGQDGKTLPIQTPRSIRFRYGEPGDVYTDSAAGRVTQEWWYWDKGLTFTFEETDAGWDLIDTYEFTPVETEPSKEAPIIIPGLEEGNPNGTLYYTLGRNIWAIEADGTNQRWIAPGTRPTTTSDGSKLLFLDTSGNIYLVEPGREASAQLVLSRRKAGVQPTISNNGKVAAFTQDTGGYRRVILKNLDTGEESAIPAGTMDMYHPAWSSDDELIAYSASPPSSPDQRDRNRDIYYYDLVAGRTERVSMSPLDEFDPTWSPLDRRVLVYCRAENDHAQLWIVSFDADGKPVERQLTKYGGRNPAWSPRGDKIIYESNAQLWTIKPDGSDESPIIVDGEPIFGLDPFWTR